jgi:hypothetical protein
VIPRSTNPQRGLGAGARALLGAVGLSLALGSCGGEPGVDGAPGNQPLAHVPAGAVPTDGPVRLVCEAPDFDFGQVWEGAVVDHHFDLEVRGTGELALQAAKSSCGCTTPSLEFADGRPYTFGTALRAGDRLRLAVQFASRNRPGPQERPVTLYGNLPDEGRFQLRLLGRVGPYLESSREELELGAVLLHSEARAETELRTADGLPAQLLIMTLPPPPADLQVELAPIEPDLEGRSARWKLSATLTADGAIGGFHWPVRVETADPDGQRSDVGTTVFVRWSRVRPVEVQPVTFALGIVRPGQGAARQVRLVSHDPSFDLGAVDLAAAEIELRQGERDLTGALRCEPLRRDGEAWLELSTAGFPAGVEGALSGWVRLELGHPLQPRLEIRVEALAAAQ